MGGGFVAGEADGILFQEGVEQFLHADAKEDPASEEAGYNKGRNYSRIGKSGSWVNSVLLCYCCVPEISRISWNSEGCLIACLKPSGVTDFRG